MGNLVYEGKKRSCIITIVYQSSLSVTPFILQCVAVQHCHS